MFRRMRDSKGEAAVAERPIAVVPEKAAQETAEQAPEAPKAESSRELASSRLQLSGAAPMPQTELDGDAKRRRRLLSLRVDLHRKLLESLNLSAIEKVSENELRSEIGEIAREELATSDLVLSRVEFDRLVKELRDAGECAGALRRLLDSRPGSAAAEPRFHDYMELHSRARFRAELAQLLGEPDRKS